MTSGHSHFLPRKLRLSIDKKKVSHTTRELAQFLDKYSIIRTNRAMASSHRGENNVCDPPFVDQLYGIWQ